MANPEHVKIVKMGHRAINRWRERQLLLGKPARLDLRGAKFKKQELSNVCLAGALLQGTNFTYSCLKGADLSFADFSQAMLVKTNLRHTTCVETNFQSAKLLHADLRGSKLSRADFSYARLLRARLNGVEAIETRFCAAILCEANLVWTNLSGSDFSEADCTGAYFWNAKLHRVQFAACILRNAKMSGIWLHETNTDRWTIDDVVCKYFFLGTDKQRIPVEGMLALGEFEDRFKSRPTIEFIFKSGMPALGPAAL